MIPRERFAQIDFDLNFEHAAWYDIAVEICLGAGVRPDEMRRVPSSDHVVFLIGNSLVLKIFRPQRNCFERELKALRFAAGRIRFATPEITAAGNFEGLDYMVFTQVPGRAFSRAEFMELAKAEQIGFVTELAAGLKQLHGSDAAVFEDDWAAFVEERAASFVERQVGHGVNPKVIDALPTFIEKNLSLVPRTPTCFLHGDVHFGNLRLVRGGGGLRIGGIFDFADSRRGYHEYEFLAVGVLMLQGERELQREFFRAYGYADAEMDEEMRRRLMMLTMLYETSDLRRYALRLRPEAVHFTLDELERAIWSFV
jgi:hygromycin-B 7''-O-kinase